MHDAVKTFEKSKLHQVFEINNIIMDIQDTN